VRVKVTNDSVDIEVNNNPMLGKESKRSIMNLIWELVVAVVAAAIGTVIAYVFLNL